MVSFALVLYAASIVYEALAVITEKEQWRQLARIHIIVATGAVFLTMLSGAAAYNISWMDKDGKQVMTVHKILGIVVLFLAMLMANYRFLLEKSLPPIAFKVYLGVGALTLGLLVGTAYVGKTGVFIYGAGVDKARVSTKANEEYLKKLYGLDKLPVPSGADSLAALPLRPVSNDSIAVKSIVQAEIK
jgi:uncharacterized membrane protein